MMRIDELVRMHIIYYTTTVGFRILPLKRWVQMRLQILKDSMSMVIPVAWCCKSGSCSTIVSNSSKKHTIPIQIDQLKVADAFFGAGRRAYAASRRDGKNWKYWGTHKTRHMYICFKIYIYKQL